MTPVEFVEQARRVAEDVLFPNAMTTDGLDAVPVSNLDAIAGAGLYGVSAPVMPGGEEVEFEIVAKVAELLAGGCLSTAFIWAQHQGLVRAMAEGPKRLRDVWLEPLCRGERRAGVALGGLLPGPPKLRAAPEGDVWRLDGVSPWVTGWRRLDVLLVAARGPEDTVVWLMVDAVDQPGLEVERQRLVAVDASMTVELRFDGATVPGERLMKVAPYEEGLYSQDRVLRTVGFLSIGVAERCCRLLGPSPLDDELAAARQGLLMAGPEGIPTARAAASELTARAALTLVAASGSTSILCDRHPQRLAREALFLLVFGSRPPIKAALVPLLQRSL
ncbi:MAG: acyl-CoA/acyl-ACP dehydrogenase [Actinobacteria bacterium]|nr:acyl-CoA/acyl-ACP dehydrogenase [Actinomycetota bacterium]